VGRKRKQQGPTPEELEAQADALLSKADHDLLVSLAENMDVLRAGFEQLKMPSNDPEYLKRLQDADAQRNAIANKVDTIHIVPDKGKTWIGVGLTNPRSNAEAQEVARLMGQHFEAKVINHEG